MEEISQQGELQQFRERLLFPKYAACYPTAPHHHKLPAVPCAARQQGRGDVHATYKTVNECE